MSNYACPSHHPLHGEEDEDKEIVIHDHDVLCGRGVNLAAHPGNERFRALVQTKYDESYCTTFTTREKRALAQEIIDHITSLSPPGRFLKRPGKSHTNRGLKGPWEKVPPKEVLKKTCQAIRDCNRNDRSGYAAGVSIPEDVKQHTEERTKLGLSLKEYAAAAVAREHLSPVPSCVTSILVPPAAHGVTAFTALGKRSPHCMVDERDGGNDNRFPPSENGANWLKRQRVDQILSRDRNEASRSPHEAVTTSLGGADHTFSAAALGHAATMGTIETTPRAPPVVRPVPVTNTSIAQPYHTLYSDNVHSGHATDPTESLHRSAPDMPPSPSFNPFSGEDAEGSSVAMAAVPAPYSPVVWNRHDDDDDGEIDESAEPVPMSEWKHHPYGHGDDGQQDEMLQSAAHAAAALINSSDSRGDFPLLDGDDIPHGSSLDINELE
jgi:hypothetical protein